MLHHIPPIIDFPKNGRVIAIGDIHGDLSFLIDALRKTKIANSKNEWIGGNSIVVQVGDQLDDTRDRSQEYRGGDKPNIDSTDIDILNFTNDLHLEAVKHGGMFISLFGNHEILNVLADKPGLVGKKRHAHIKKYLKSVSNKSVIEFANPDSISYEEKVKSGLINRANLFKPGNDFAKMLACTRLPLIVIGDYIFLHAGITVNTMKKLNIQSKDGFYKIQYVLRKYLLNILESDDEKKYAHKIVESDIFWSRILGSIPKNLDLGDDRCSKYIEPILKLLKLKSIIIGHTSNETVETCNNKLIKLNSMSSKSFNMFKDMGYYIEKETSILEILPEGIMRIVK
jgi:hypothetical protein